MKNLLMPIYLILILFPFQKSRGQENQLPEDIAEFYSLYNLISTNSTLDERQQILTKYPSVKEFPDSLLDERLREIRKAMDEFEKFISAFSERIPNAMQSTGTNRIYREINQPVSWNTADGKYIVKTEVFTFSHEKNLYFIQNYKDGKNYPDQYENPEDLKLSRQEIHTWTRSGNKWIKSSVNKILIN